MSVSAPLTPFPYAVRRRHRPRVERGRIAAQGMADATEHPGTSAPVPGAPYGERAPPMQQSRFDRFMATARLLPSAPIIGFVVVLGAFGLAPAEAGASRAS